MLALLVLFQFVPHNLFTPTPRSLHDIDETLRSRVHHTAFDDYVLDRFPGLLTVQQITQDMQHQLQMLPASNLAWRCCETWDVHDLRRAQVFWIYVKMRGHVGSECGPCWAMQCHRAMVQATLGNQRAAGDSKFGLDHLPRQG